MKYRAVLLFTTLMLPGLVIAGDSTLLFEDNFDHELGDGWTWLREQPNDWRINEGSLEIRVQPGKAKTVKNALVRKAPDRSTSKYAIEVTVAFTADPTNQYEQAGITWYHNDDPVFKLVHEHVDEELLIVPGFKPTPSQTVQLRLVVNGEHWTALYRENSKDAFRTAASGQLPPPGDDQISLQCYDGPSDSTHWVRFDDFRIIEISE